MDRLGHAIRWSGYSLEVFHLDAFNEYARHMISRRTFWLSKCQYPALLYKDSKSERIWGLNDCENERIIDMHSHIEPLSSFRERESPDQLSLVN